MRKDWKALKHVRTRRIDSVMLSWKPHVLPGEKSGCAQPDFEMFYPPARSVTNDCALRTLNLRLSQRQPVCAVQRMSKEAYLNK